MRPRYDHILIDTNNPLCLNRFLKNAQMLRHYKDYMRFRDTGHIGAILSHIIYKIKHFKTDLNRFTHF